MMKRYTYKKTISSLVLIVMLVGLSVSLKAWEFRQYSRIGPSQLQGKPGARSAQSLNLPPVPREAIEQIVREFFDAWNSGSVDSFLAPEFVDKDRLLDAIADTVPRDAKINVLNIRSAYTVPSDLIEELDNGQGFDRLVTVVATVDTQIEYNDANGFQKIRGESEYTFTVREEYR